MKPAGKAFLLFLLLPVSGQLPSCGDFALFEDTADEVEAAISWSTSSGRSSPLSCEKDRVWLSAAKSSGNGDLSYAWALATPGSESEASLGDADAETTSFRPDMPGTYTVTLAIEDEDGKTDTVSKMISASYEPIAEATASAAYVCPGQQALLYSAESSNPLAYDDGCTSDGLIFQWTVKDPNGYDVTDDVLDHPLSSQPTFTAPDGTGTYTATLTVTRDEDAATDEDSVTVFVENCS